ncbi:MAG: TonB C-terminal domain-containing protein [Nitrospirae bacterium]|nr:TonB C-terminal domain-containing protein [Nitrospirota bacterium]
MRGPSLQATTVLSAALHLTFFLIAALILRYSRNVVMPSPYEVSLVGPTSSSRGGATEEIPGKREQGTGIEHIRQPEKAVRDSKADLKRLEEQLSALKAKKKMHDIVDLHRKVSSVSGSQSKSSPKSSGRGSGSSQGTATYMDKIVAEIKAGWFYPDWADKDLLMTINVRIQKDGTIQVLEIEQKSGNPLFDRSVQQAIIKASPVTPPPQEMEIGMRFYP